MLQGVEADEWWAMDQLQRVCEICLGKPLPYQVCIGAESHADACMRHSEKRVENSSG